MYYDLGGGFTCFSSLSLLGKDSHFDEHIFQRGFETTNSKNQKFDRDHYSPNSNLLLQGSISGDMFASGRVNYPILGESNHANVW